MRYLIVRGTKEIGSIVTSDNCKTMDFISIFGNLHQIVGVHDMVGLPDVKVMRVSAAYEDAKS